MVGLPGALLDPLWTTILGTATHSAKSNKWVDNTVTANQKTGKIQTMV